MLIKSIRLCCFKNSKDKTFEFKDRNILKGKNGSGKTAIQEAIIFALYNRTLDGSKDTDRYIKKGQDCCEVELVTDKHTYFRKRSKKQTDFKIDNKIGKLKELIPFEVFSSVFNVGYFMKLTEKVQRDLILQHTPKIDRKALFTKIGGNTKLLNKKQNLDDLQDVIKSVGAKKLAKTKERDKYKAQLEYLEKFPYNKLKVSKPVLSKVEKVINKEISRLSSSHEDCQLAVTILQQHYKTLSKIPNEEMKRKLKTLLTSLHKEFKEVELVLSELLKSEMGYREIFRFVIDGIEYANLSSGEKLRFDLVISRFFDSLLKEPISCYFVDNVALLDEDIEVPIQSFVSRIWPFDLEITNE